MKLFGKFSIVVLFLLLMFGCEEETVQSIPVRQEFPYEISVAKYSQSHFFVDTLYRHLFEDYHQSYPPLITYEMLYNSLTEIEVWINTTNAVELGRILARAYINLPTRTSRFDSYPILYDTLTESHPGKFEEGYFKRLEINKDYRVSEYTGTISMNFSVADNQTIAAAYRTYDGKYYGEFIGIDTNQMPLILKLIKPRSIHPSYSPAWDMMLKNIYKLDTSLLSLPNNNFDLEIVYKSQNGLEDTTIIGEHLLRIVGLDKYSDNGGENPDHRFDFLPRFTIDRENGEIIFPTLRPFDSGIRDFFQQKNPPVNVPDSLLFPSFYDMRLTYEQQHPKSGYFIKWKFYNQ